MAYSFKPGESVPAAIRRIVLEEIEAASTELEGHGAPDRDEAIHEARKNVKKIRGVLKLMRPELGDLYARENVRFGAIGHQLASFRDAGAMLEIFDQIDHLYRDEWGRHDMSSIRAKLLGDKAFGESSSSFAEVLSAASEELLGARDDVKRWPLREDGFAALAKGLQATYAHGRHAFDRAGAEPSQDSFHDWRKRVKDHWYQIRLIGQVCGDALSFYQKNLKYLETALGDDHNLGVLSAKIEMDKAAYGDPVTVGLFLATLENRQKNLRSTANSIGYGIYREKPKVFVKQMGNLWKAWIKDRERKNSSLPATG